MKSIFGKKYIGRLFVMIIFMTVFLSITSYADDVTPYTYTGPQDVIDKVGKDSAGVYNMINKIFGGSKEAKVQADGSYKIQDATDTDIVNTMKSFDFKISSFTIFSSKGKEGVSLQEIVRLLASCILIVYFVFDLVSDKLQPGKELTIEAWLFTFGRFFICAIITLYSSSILTKFYELAQAILDSVSSATQGVDGIQTCIDEIFMLYANSWKVGPLDEYLFEFIGSMDYMFKCLGSKIELMLPYLGALAQIAAGYFALATRGIKLVMYIVFAPVATSDFYNGGMHSRGASFIKGFFALSLQAVFILVMIVVFKQIQLGMIGYDPSTQSFSGNTNDLIDFATLLKLTTMNIAQCSLIIGSEKIANTVFGT